MLLLAREREREREEERGSEIEGERERDAQLPIGTISSLRVVPEEVGESRVNSSPLIG